MRARWRLNPQGGMSGRWQARGGAVVLSAAVLALLIAAATALAVTGELTQLPGTAGCISENGSGGTCADGKALSPPVAVVVSPDGKNAYLGTFSSWVAVFTRDPATGALTQLPGPAGCVSETGTTDTPGDVCVDAKAVDGASSMAVSPDGKHVYVASGFSDAVAVFARDTTNGALTQLPGTAGCVSHTGSGGQCADGRALSRTSAVAVSADGKSVYATSAGGNAIAVFARDTTTGELTQLGGAAACMRATGTGCRVARALENPISVTVSPDDRNVYVAAAAGDAILVFRRNATTGALYQPTTPAGCVSEDGTGGSCTDGKALDAPLSVVVSPDSRHVYAASAFSDAVAIFRRNSTTGALEQPVGPAGRAGCVSDTGSAGACGDAKALDVSGQNGWATLAISPDGANVYVASGSSQAVAVFSRHAASGALLQPAGTAGCVSETGSGPCADGKALALPRGVGVSADGKNVYAASGNAIAVFARQTSP
jgi:DNA-binding beta-propeller fold protein YncE